MANERREQRTEQPTPKRRREFKREGKTARSADVGVVFSLLGLLLIIRTMGPTMARGMRQGLEDLLAGSANGLEGPLIREAITGIVVTVLGPVLVIGVVLAIVASLIQTGPVYAPKALKPNLKKLNPKQGIEKFKPTKMAWELGRVLMKVALLALVLWGPLATLFQSAGRVEDLGVWLERIESLIFAVLFRALALATVIAGADYAYNRYKLNRDRRMTKQEVKDEYRQNDGDPLMKGRRRERARELSRNRMIIEVGSADVVVVNPVRLAVALRYNDAESAPRVVARGAGSFARQIRSEAYRHGVPVRHDPPLARALYRRCRVGQYVPAELFEAVAVVLAAVYRRRWTRRPLVTT